jgi:hypothetical protein
MMSIKKNNAKIKIYPIPKTVIFLTKKPENRD